MNKLSLPDELSDFVHFNIAEIHITMCSSCGSTEEHPFPGHYALSMGLPMWHLILLAYLAIGALGGWGGEDDEDTWQPSSSSSSSQCLPTHSWSPSSTDVMVHMATAWDEELSFHLQEEEIAQATRGDVCGPDPATLPWPFPNKTSVEDGVTSPSLGSSSSFVGEQAPKWPAELLDRRALRRGQRERSSSLCSPSTSTTCSTPTTSTAAAPLCARDPSSLTSPSVTKPGILRKGKWGVDPGTSTSSADEVESTTPAPEQTVQPASCTPEVPLVSKHEQLHDGAEAGCLRRFGQWRSGRDRWHNVDGSLINRCRPSHPVTSLSQQQLATCLATIDEESNGFRENGSRNIGDELVVDINMANNVQACEPANDSKGQTNSTTAGDEPFGGYSSSTSSASSDVSSAAVGFWRHGIWHPRPRDAQEARSHAGGRGPQRMERKSKRVEAWLQGTWKPAWLQQYIQDKTMRQAKLVADDAAVNSVHSVVEQGPESNTVKGEHWTQDPLSGWWSCSRSGSSLSPVTCPWDGVVTWDTPADNPTDMVSDSVQWHGWVNWHDWGDITSSSSPWQVEDDETDKGTSLEDRKPCSPTSSTSSTTTCSTCTTTSSTTACSTCTDDIARDDWEEIELTSTTSSSTSPILPNEGLYPEVREVDGFADETVMMQLTGSERQRLQEAGVPHAMIQRLENFFEAMNNHQDADRGPESRWALQRFTQRANEGLEALDTLMGIMGRRLVPRGFWPVERLPATEASRWNLFQWARSAATIFQQTLEWHLATPLQPTETLVTSPYSSLNTLGDSARGDEVASARSRSRSRSPRGGSVDESLEGESDRTRGDCVASSSASSSNANVGASGNLTYDSLPSGIQLALDGHLLGVWSEPPSGSADGTVALDPPPVDDPASLVPVQPPVVEPVLPVPVQPMQLARFGVVPRARAGASGGGAEGDGDGDGNGEP